jgi:hypothetical protein
MTLLVLRVRELPQPIAYRVLGPSGTLLATAAKKPGSVVAVVGPPGRDGEAGAEADVSIDLLTLYILSKS